MYVHIIMYVFFRIHLLVDFCTQDENLRSNSQVLLLQQNTQSEKE